MEIYPSALVGHPHRAVVLTVKTACRDCSQEGARGCGGKSIGGLMGGPARYATDAVFFSTICKTQ